MAVLFKETENNLDNIIHNFNSYSSFGIFSYKKNDDTILLSKEIIDMFELNNIIKPNIYLKINSIIELLSGETVFYKFIEFVRNEDKKNKIKIITNFSKSEYIQVSCKQSDDVFYGFCVNFSRSINEIHQLEEMYHRQNIIARELFESYDQLLWWIDFTVDGYVVNTSKKVEYLENTDPNDNEYCVYMIKSNIQKFKKKHPEYVIDISKIDEKFREVRNGNLKKVDIEFPFEYDNEIVWLRIRANVTKSDSNNQPEFMLGILENITGEVNKRKFMFSDYYDEVTGIYNRKSCMKHLDKVIKQKSYGYGLFVDLDDFKRINDKYGHVIGDKVLRIQAQGLKKYIENYGEVFRLAGDEFFIYIEKDNLDVDIDYLVKKISLLLSVDMNVNDMKIKSSSSIGISEFSEDGLIQDVEQLIKYADTAMFISKREGKNRYVYANHDNISEFEKGIEFEKELKRAINNQEFTPFYQPKVDIKTNKIIGCEALARWISPNNEIVSPAEFIPLAESTGDIGDIDLIIANSALRDYSSWKKQGLINDDFVISFNFSIATITAKDIDLTLKYYLQIYNIPTDAIEVEVTESISHNNHVIQKLNELVEMGVQVSLDDFGAGHSSIDCLLDLPIRVIKFDRKLISNVSSSQKSRDIYYYLSEMAKKLELDILAEGIEDLSQRDFLLDMGTNVGQGYLYSKPLDNESFKNLLTDKDGYIV